MDFMSCDTWSSRDKLESYTTPRLLTFCASETRLVIILIGKCGRSCLRFFEAYQNKDFVVFGIVIINDCISF